MKTLIAALISTLTLISHAAVPWTFSSGTYVSNAPSMLNSNFNSLGAIVYDLPDLDTNGVLRSDKQLYWSPSPSNGITFAVDTRYTIPGGAVTNYAGADYTVVDGDPQMEYSEDGGTTWISGASDLITTNPVTLSFFYTNYPAIATPIAPILTNIYIYTLTRPDLYGRTNGFIGQSLRVSHPVLGDEAANKAYVDTTVAAVNFMQNGGLYLSGAQLNLSQDWHAQADTNGMRWKYRGANIIDIANPADPGGEITWIALTNTTVHIKVWTNGLVYAPRPQWTANLAHPQWVYVDGYTTVTNSFPTPTGTNYLLSFTRPNSTYAFIKIGASSSDPNIINLAGVLSTTSRTITNATDSTWGRGSGLVTWDTNYLYISVATNAWKRVGLTNW